MIFALAMIVLSAIISIATSVILAPTVDVSTELWFSSEGIEYFYTTFINVVISVIGFGVIGMVLGLLLRSPISAISLGVLWLLIVENLLVAVKNSTQSWLPGSQLSIIATGGNADVSYSHALATGGAYVAVGALVASILFVRRDVAN